MPLLDVERSRVGWWTLGAVLGGALLFVVYSFVGTFVFGAFIYYATRPVYRRLRRHVRPPSLAAGIALFALALPALSLAGYALTVVVFEIFRWTNASTFDLTQYPGVDRELLVMLSDPEAFLANDLARYLTTDTLRSLLSSLGSAADTLAFFGIGLVHLFVMIALAFYLLRDDQRLSRFVIGRFGDERGILEEFVRAVDNDFNNIFFGNILNAVLTGTIGVIAYTLLNTVAPASVRIPAAALVGMLAGVASLIPVVGMKLVYVPVALYMTAIAVLGGATGELWFVVVFAAVSFVVVDTIPDLVLRPYVSGRSLHVGAVMLAYTLGPLLFGWYGIFLMPMVLVLAVHFARLVLPELVRGRPIQPYMVDPVYLTESPPPDATRTTPTPDVAAATNEPDGEDGATPDDESSAATTDGSDLSGERGASPSELDVEPSDVQSGDGGN